MNKFFLKSKTVVGVLILAAPQILPEFGISFSADDAAFINGQVDAICAGLAAILGLYGRARASVGISFKPRRG